MAYQSYSDMSREEKDALLKRADIVPPENLGELVDHYLDFYRDALEGAVEADGASYFNVGEDEVQTLIDCAVDRAREVGRAAIARLEGSREEMIRKPLELDATELEGATMTQLLGHAYVCSYELAENGPSDGAIKAYAAAMEEIDRREGDCIASVNTPAGEIVAMSAPDLEAVEGGDRFDSVNVYLKDTQGNMGIMAICEVSSCDGVTGVQTFVFDGDDEGPLRVDYNPVGEWGKEFAPDEAESILQGSIDDARGRKDLPKENDSLSNQVSAVNAIQGSDGYGHEDQTRDDEAR